MVQVRPEETSSVDHESPESPESMCVRWQADDRFEIRVRDHTLVVDQPASVGGAELGPTPTELFVAGLASCVAFYARRYLRRHHIDPAGLEVATSYRLGTRPARVAAVDLEIRLPVELAPQRRAALLAMAGHCTVHTSITRTPDISITMAPLRPGDDPAAAHRLTDGRTVG